LAKIKGSDTQLKIDVRKAKERIKKHGKIITSDRIVSELSLGFWVELFFDKYHDVIGDAPFISFSNRQENYSIANCYADTRYIRTYRNRLSHHDTLFIQKVMGLDEIFFTRIKEFRVRVFRVLEQIHPDLRYLASKNYDKTDNILTHISVITQ
jgi:hypothetical protein